MKKSLIYPVLSGKKLIFVFCILFLTAVTTYAQVKNNRIGRDTVIISNYQEFLVDTTIVEEGEQLEPDLAFDGTNYFIVWSGKHRISYFWVYNIYGALINASGVVTGGSGFLLFPPLIWYYQNRDPAISFDGNNYMLTWWIDGEIRCSRINCSGIPYDTVGTILAEAGAETEHLSFPEIIFSENKYFIIWEYGSNVHNFCYNSVSGSFIDISGIVIKDSIIVSDNDSCGRGYLDSDLEFDGTNYLVVWQQLTNGWLSPNNIYGTRVSSSGIVIDTSAIEIAVGIENESSPSIAFDGTNYLVVYEKGNNGFYDDIYGVRVSPSGVVLDPNAIPISTAPNEQRNPEVIYDGNNYIVVWQDNRSGSDFDIYGTVVKTSGEVENSFPVSVQPGDQVDPALTKGPGNQIMVVYSGWTSTYNGNSYNTMRIWGAKMDVTVGIENNNPNIVTNYSLFQNYPNPFNPVTTIKYQIPKTGLVILKVYDVLGKEVATLVNEKLSAGSYEVDFDGNDYSSGVYYYKLISDDYTNVKKMILIK